MKTFKDWFKTNMKDYAKDIANNGADSGYPNITYYYDTNVLFDEYENDILEMLKNTTENIGYDNIIDLLQTFNRKDILKGFFETLKRDEQSKCLLVWFACEELSNQLES